MKPGLAAGLVVSVMLALTACDEPAAPIVIDPDTPSGQYLQDPVALQRGQALFIGSCVDYCHGLTPEDTDASYLFDCEWKHGSSDAEIAAVITNGIPDTRMVGFGSNFPEGESDLYKLVAYLRANQGACGEQGG